MESMKNKIIEFADIHHQSRLAWGESDASEAFRLSAVAKHYGIYTSSEITELQKAAAELVESGFLELGVLSEGLDSIYCRTGAIAPAVVCIR
jgi:hypothetical protein